MANTEILSKILSNDLCAKWINLRDYAFDKLSSNADIKSIMDEVDKYGYGEWVCEGQVPVMTSNTAPYGECIADSEYSVGNAWKAFDNNDTSYWSSSTSANGWCGYHFIDPVIVKRVMFYPIRVTGTLRLKNYKIQGSNDGTTWTDLTDTLVADNEQKKQYVNIDNDTPYSYYRMFIIDSYGQDTLRLGSLQFYAYQPKGNVPIMTSNTAPYGEAFSGYSRSDQWKIFDEDISTFHNTTGSTMYAGYKFVNPIKVKKARTHFKSDQFSWVTGYKLQASNDGSTWVDLTEDVISSLSAGFNDVYVTKNEGYYLYYREWWTCTSGPHREYLQFYGREMKGSIPTMTSNTQPWGEAKINQTIYSSYQPYLSLNGETTNTCFVDSSASNAILYYDFKQPKKCNVFRFRFRDLDVNNYSTYHDCIPLHVQFVCSDDGENWIDIGQQFTITDNTYLTAAGVVVTDDTIGLHRYYGMKVEKRTGGIYYSVPNLQFFGFDYSERDWDTEHPMRYLYDHGVELEEMGSSGNVSKLSDKTVVDGTSAIGWFGTKNKIDITSYNLLRLLTGLIYKIGSYTPSLQVSSSSGGGAIATATLKPPHDSSLDISNVNNEQALFVGQTTYTGWQFDVEEFWLE